MNWKEEDTPYSFGSTNVATINVSFDLIDVVLQSRSIGPFMDVFEAIFHSLKCSNTFHINVTIIFHR